MGTHQTHASNASQEPNPRVRTSELLRDTNRLDDLFPGEILAAQSPR
jgi:hypothetical protein